MAIVFGSPEAIAIVERDRKRREVDAKLILDGMTREDAEQRLKNIEDDIDSLRDELAILEGERYVLARKLEGDW